MVRLARALKGLGAFALLVVVIAGIPWALWHFVGWPLPHRVPSAGQVGRALNRHGIPDQALVDALAVVVWIAWATLVATLLIEVAAALSGRQARHLPRGRDSPARGQPSRGCHHRRFARPPPASRPHGLGGAARVAASRWQAVNRSRRW